MDFKHKEQDIFEMNTSMQNTTLEKKDLTKPVLQTGNEQATINNTFVSKKMQDVPEQIVKAHVETKEEREHRYEEEAQALAEMDDRYSAKDRKDLMKQSDELNKKVAKKKLELENAKKKNISTEKEYKLKNRVVKIGVFVVCMIFFGLTGCGAETEQEPAADLVSEAGADTSQTEQAVAEEERKTDETAGEAQTVEAVEEEADFEYEGDAFTYYDEQFSEILDRYRNALKEEWGVEELYREGMSPVLTWYYGENALEKVGYTYMDINSDGYFELLIGVMDGVEPEERVVLDVYALENKIPVQCFVSEERSRFYLCEEEEGGYLVANEGSSGAQNSAWIQYVMLGQELQVVQSIVYDGLESPDAPWYMGYDEDWDISNDTPVDEELANDIIDSYQSSYMQPEYVDFELYASREE